MSATAPTRQHSIDVTGAQLAVWERGEGIPVLLIQPGLVSSEPFNDLVTRLAERYRVITFDSRGHGKSTNPSGALTYERLADDTAELIAALGLERPFVGGWSDGGEAALHLGLRYPELARGIVAGGTSVETGGDEAARAKMREFFHTDADTIVDLEAFAAENAESFLPYLQGLHRQDDAHWQRVIQWSATMWITYDGLSQEEMQQITDPTLVVIGDRDAFFPLEGVVQLTRSLPNAELAILPGSDHMRPIFEPNSLVSVLFDFFARH